MIRPTEALPEMVLCTRTSDACPQCGRDDVNHFYRVIDGVDHSVCNVCGWDSAE